MPTKTKVTRKQAEAVLAAVVKAFPAYCNDFDENYNLTPMDPASPNMPALFENWDTYSYVIIWESGSPYDWPQLFPHGGADQEYGFSVPPVALPKGVWTEAVNGCVLAIFPS